MICQKSGSKADEVTMNHVPLAIILFLTLEGGSRIYGGKHRFAEALMSEIGQERLEKKCQLMKP